MNTDYEHLLGLINESLTCFLPADDRISHLLYESESYSLLAGGKRLRPMLVLGTCVMCGGNYENALPFAIAMEYIHTYSLIHDDLPAMDNDDYRRGKLTNHKMFGENIAILAGDGLLTAAMGIMADAIKKDPSQKNASAMNAVSTAAYNMIRGQVGDVKADENITVADLEYIHENKTAALIKGAILAGAYSAGADINTVSELEKLGTHFGMAFQLADDILDFETDTCLNYAQTCGKDAAISAFEKHMKSAEGIINKYNNNDILKILFNNLFMSING